jgi:hypothetical protein
MPTIVHLPVAVVIDEDGVVYDCWVNHEDPPWNIDEEIVRSGAAGVAAAQWLASRLPEHRDVDADVLAKARLLLPAVLGEGGEHAVTSIADARPDSEDGGLDLAS